MLLKKKHQSEKQLCPRKMAQSVMAAPTWEKFSPTASPGYKDVGTPPDSPTDLGPKMNMFDAAAVPAKNDISVAEKVVLTMGISDTYVQLAKFSHFLKHGHNSAGAHELFAAAEDLLKCPEEARNVKKLFEQAQKEEKVKGKDLVDNKDNETYVPSKVSISDSAEMLKLKEAPVESTSSVDGKAQLKEKVKRLAQENHRLRQRKTCRACRTVDLASSGVTFLPCGHFITCEICSEKFDDCPACGKSIMGTVRTFLS